MRARTPGNVRERVLSVTSPDRISRGQEHPSKLRLQRPCLSQLLPAWALDMPCHKQAGAGFRPAPGQCDLSLELFASTSSQHTPTPLTGGPSARTCLLWARAVYHGYGEPVPTSRCTDLLHAKPTSRPACTSTALGALQVGFYASKTVCPLIRQEATVRRPTGWSEDSTWTLTGLHGDLRIYGFQPGEKDRQDAAGPQRTKGLGQAKKQLSASCWSDFSELCPCLAYLHYYRSAPAGFPKKCHS